MSPTDERTLDECSIKIEILQALLKEQINNANLENLILNRTGIV